MTSYHDYLAILVLPDSVQQQIERYKALAFDATGYHGELDHKGNIIAASWLRKSPFWVEPIITKMEKDASLLPELKLSLNHFGFMQTGDRFSIYARIASDASIVEWFKKLSKYLGTKVGLPRITIADNIPYTMFKTLWQQFKDERLEESLVVAKLTIMKRETIAHYGSWSFFKEFAFNKNLNMLDTVPVKKSANTVMPKAACSQQISLF